MFRKKVISLHRVRDKITIKEGADELDLYVDTDATTLVHKLRDIKGKLENATDEGDRCAAAFEFSEAIFGTDQTECLFDFYHGDYRCVITICGMYFSSPEYGLAKKITKAQKRG